MAHVRKKKKLILGTTNQNVASLCFKVKDFVFNSKSIIDRNLLTISRRTKCDVNKSPEYRLQEKKTPGAEHFTMHEKVANYVSLFLKVSMAKKIIA